VHRVLGPPFSSPLSFVAYPSPFFATTGTRRRSNPLTFVPSSLRPFSPLQLCILEYPAVDSLLLLGSPAQNRSLFPGEDFCGPRRGTPSFPFWFHPKIKLHFPFPGVFDLRCSLAFLSPRHARPPTVQCIRLSRFGSPATYTMVRICPLHSLSYLRFPWNPTIVFLVPDRRSLPVTLLPFFPREGTPIFSPQHNGWLATSPSHHHSEFFFLSASPSINLAFRGTFFVGRLGPGPPLPSTLRERRLRSPHAASATLSSASSCVAPGRFYAPTASPHLLFGICRL